MALLSEEDFRGLLIQRKILYFPCAELNTPVPHHFILITTQDDGTLLLSCGTSQFDTMKRLIQINRFPEKTFVYIPESDKSCPLTKDTFINCNEYFPYSFEELWEMYMAGELKITGDLPIEYYQQIVIGFLESRIIEEEIKDLLPNPDDIA